MSKKTTAPAAKVSIAGRYDPTLAERIRNACYWQRLGVNDLITAAVTREIERLEKANGGPFKKRPTELRPGRRAS
jgi:hypothetical protein